jgi:hypothetical protein
VSKFDREKFLIRVQGGRLYLPVAARLVWFRMEHPAWTVATDAVEINMEMQYAIFRATIMDDTGRVISTATKMEDKRGFGDWIEKAETGAVGRALLMAGYGTEDAGEDLDEGDRLADSPQPIRTAQNRPAATVWTGPPENPLPGLRTQLRTVANGYGITFKGNTEEGLTRLALDKSAAPRKPVRTIPIAEDYRRAIEALHREYGQAAEAGMEEEDNSEPLGEAHDPASVGG